ncbi:MAG: AIPR family protein [Pseudomonadota bacterium]|nr:AIPR family protein [Pseudomonadota bacterium]
MIDNIDEFFQDFFQDIRSSADADGEFLESSFVEIFCNYLIDAGEFDTYDAGHYRAAKGMRVDGYAGDPAEEDGVLTLFISDFIQDDKLGTLTKTEMSAIFKRLENFYIKARSPEFSIELEETSAGYGIAALISARADIVRRVRFFLLSNRKLSERVKGIEEGMIGGIPVTYHVWDISRLHRMVMSGKGKEDMDIDFAEEYRQSLPCLPAHLTDASYEAYLAVVPGELLASIYEKWGTRLLEQNVRCFLQARSNVNKGIRSTILGEPEMFFAYNNGVTATAESVELIEDNGQQAIRSIRNLQIVNGGQTTASIFSARKKDTADLSSIFVQMKLSVIPPDKTIDVVPKISEYANSQNRVNAADFFSNHPYHIRLEEFSRRLWAPSTEGSFKETKWFYERARGQYLDEQTYKTPSQKRKFQEEYPRAQMFSKTDLAKFENVWRLVPHIVSQGAQKNFSNFANFIGKEWDSEENHFNEFYYKCLIGKAIIFKRLEKIISNLNWYKQDPGYRANIVAYTLSWIGNHAQSKDKSVNFLEIWAKQNLTDPLVTGMEIIAKEVRSCLVDTPAGISNVTEWAKKPGCWDRIREVEIPLHASFEKELVNQGSMIDRKKAASRTQKIDNGIRAQAKVVEIGGDGWRQILNWAIAQNLIGSKDEEILMIASQIPSKIPTEKQSIHLLKLLQAFKQEGWR